MEEKTKRHVITPVKGICKAPSDLTCDDEQLKECEGMVMLNGELVPLQRPAQEEYVNLAGGILLYVHSFASNTFFIYKEEYEGEYMLFYTTRNNVRQRIGEDTFPDIISVNSIGRTLIVQTSEEMHYFLCKDINDTWQYTRLGNDVPEPHLECKMDGTGTSEGSKSYFSYRVDILAEFAWVGRAGYGSGGSADVDIVIEDQTAFNDLVWGAYSRNKNEIKKKGCFCNPFFIRVAVELYDGTYAKVSAPILMLPFTKDNTIAVAKTDDGWNTAFITGYAKLFLQQTTDYTDWKDIVSNVCIFVSRELDLYDTTKDAIVQNVLNERFFQGIRTAKSEDSGESAYHYVGGEGSRTEPTPQRYVIRCNGDINFEAESGRDDTYWVFPGPYRLMPSSYITTQIPKESNFYLVANLGLESMGTFKEFTEVWIPDCLSTLETRTRLEGGDFYAHTHVTPRYVSTLNRRMIMADIDRDFFDGFTNFMPYTLRYENPAVSPTMQHYTAVVTIETDSGERRIVKSWESKDIITANTAWFYYPDPRAKRLTLYNYNTKVIDEVRLKEHEGLHGAYYYGENMPDGTEVVPYNQSDNPPSVDENNDKEYIGDYLMVSEVDNPYTFNASGYVRVGSGKILGIAGLTTALTNDAYKVSTIICFTTQGIWALLTNNEGVIVNVPPPFSREVCSNPESITMIDNSVVFVSARGLFLVTDRGCECISTQMNGTDRQEFIGFLQTCRIAYDYKRNLLIMYQENEANVWVYNLNSKTFSTSESFLHDYDILTSAGQYPDVYIQGGSEGTGSYVYSLMNTPERDDDSNTYSGSIESRPMKLDGSLYLKSLRRVRSLKLFNDNAIATLTLYGSNDLTHWSELHSLNGKGYRFFKYRYEFTDLKATDSYSGLVLDTQVRYTDRPH